MNRILEEDIKRVSHDEQIEKLAGSTVFITGATGLVGSLLIRSLLCFNKENKNKIKVVGLIRDQEKARRIFGNAAEDPCLHFVEGDLTERICVPEKVDYIVHTASATASKYFVTYPAETLDITYTGTKNILKVASENHVKGMVYLSSMEMYGRPDPKLDRVKENDLGYIDILNVRSSYSEGKRIAECLCAAYADEYHVPVRIARLAQTFGAGVLSEDNRVYAQFARSAIKGENIVLHTAGKSYGNYCYTSDVLRAVLLLLNKGENGQAYNVCNEKTTTTIADMAHMVADEYSGGKSKVVFDIPEDARIYGYAPDVKMRLSSEKLRKLGWKPEFGLKEMYERLIRYFINVHKN